MHITTAQEEADEMADAIQDISEYQLAWLVLHNPDFKRLAEWSPSSVLLGEMLRRIVPTLEGMTPTSKGWITEHGVIEYE